MVNNDISLNDFEIDTGADVSPTSTKTYDDIGSPSLTASTKFLQGQAVKSSQSKANSQQLCDMKTRS
jgi:hypothetical protein